MKKIFEDVYQTEKEHPIPDLPEVTAHAYLLIRDEGNVLFYNTSQNDEIEEIRSLGGISLPFAAAFMVILDSATVFTALPTIQKELGFSANGLQWVVNAYALSFGALMLLGGRMADLLGSRKVFIWGNILFLISSVFCGVAWSPEVLH